MRRRGFRALARDVSGAALAEFAIILPLMLLLLIGAAEVVEGIEAQRRVAAVASSIGDVTAREQTVSTATLNDIFLAGATLMLPLRSDQLGERLASFTADASGKVTLDWSAEGPVPYAGTADLNPAGIALKPNESVIVADASYPYQTLMRWVLPGAIPMQKRMLLTPRIASQVQKTG